MLYGFTITNGNTGTSGDGGGIRITNNHGAGDNVSGAISITHNSLAEIVNNEITGNQALRRGGAIYITGGGTTAAVKNNVISGNSSGNHNSALGGAMCLGDVLESVIHDNVISNNHSNWRAGGIYFFRSAVVKDARSDLRNSPDFRA